MKSLLFLLLLILSIQCESQVSGNSVNYRKSAFNDVGQWFRMDSHTGSSGSYVLTDLSNNHNNATQQAGTVTFGTAANGQAKMTGNSAAYFYSNYKIKNFPVTIVTFYKVGSNVPAGFYGHQGAAPASTLWCGYESTNRYAFYTSSTGNANLSTDANVGTDECAITLGGVGMRVPIINGIIRPASEWSVSSGTQTLPLATSVGTAKRFLNNLDLYEILVWERILSLDEIDEIHAYGNNRYGLHIPLWSSYTRVPLLILTGQSNASGRAARGTSDVNVPTQYQGAQTGVQVWDGSSFATLNIQSNNHMLGESGGVAALYVGMECALTSTYRSRVGGTVYLFKYSKGGTYLAANQSGPGYWSIVDNSLPPSNGQRIYPIMLTSWWTMMASFQANSQLPVVKGLIYYQGEADAQDSADANAWYENARLYFSGIQQEMGLGFFNVYLCRINTNTIYPYTSIVHDAGTALAGSVKNLTTIDTDSYPLQGDGLHLDMNGQISLGQTIANLIQP